MSLGRYDDLRGRVAIVTGGASGLGEAFVRALAANGAAVAFLDRQVEAGTALSAALTEGGSRVHFEPCDLLDLDVLRAALARVHAALGPASVLVNNAAVDQRHDLQAVGEDDFEFMINVNLRHVVFASQAVAPQMKELGGGSIVNMSSMAWIRGIADLPLYSAAKAGIVGFSNSLARRLGPDNIRVNVIAPGHIPTPRQRALWFDPDKEAAMLALQCLPGAMEPADAAELVLFLASDASRKVTKQVLVINAGSL